MLHVPSWRPIKLQPKDINFVKIQLEVVEELGLGEHKDDGEDLATLVCGRDSPSIGKQQ